MESLNWLDASMLSALERRQDMGTFRHLIRCHTADLQNCLDFSSNDYLGLARDNEQLLRVEAEFKSALRTHRCSALGATGSRLLSGDFSYLHDVEEYLAAVHRRPASLLCNSGYDANLAIVSCLPCNVILFDEYIHNSLHVGVRLWGSKDVDKRSASFMHNNAADLTRQLNAFMSPRARIIVLVESVYSMDGDISPLREILATAACHGAFVVVDEAHGLGVFGRPENDKLGVPGTGVLAKLGLEEHAALMCSVHTFGKAAGCHGAVICGTETLKSYIINYGYPVIYSTALPLHSVVSIRCAYHAITGAKGAALRAHLQEIIWSFCHRMKAILKQYPDVTLIPSTSPIQALIIPGNNRCTRFCLSILSKSKNRIKLYPIKSPTVPTGLERVRIILHAHNKLVQLDDLLVHIKETLKEMEHWSKDSKL